MKLTLEQETVAKRIFSQIWRHRSPALAVPFANHLLEAIFPPCHWTLDNEGFWNGTCGIDWTFDEGGPKENDMKFCPECGHEVQIKE